MGIDLGRFKQDLADQALDEKLNADAIDKAEQKQKRKPSKKIDESAWTEWLSDDKPSAVAQQELREKRKERANRYFRRPFVTPGPIETTQKSGAAQPAAGVSIHISVPEFHKPEFKRTKAAKAYALEHITRRQIITSSIIVMVVVLLCGSLAILKQLNNHKTAKVATTTSSDGHTLGVTTPPFTPAVPSTEQQLVTPDGKNSIFNAQKGSYSFYDKIGSKQFIVSEQNAKSSDNANKLASQAAKSLHTNSQLKTGWGTVYVITNPNDASQRLVLGVRELLVFIQSSYTLTNDQWTTYINSLQ